MARLPVEQGAHNAELRSLLHKSPVLLVVRTIGKHQLQFAYIRDARLVEIIALDTNRSSKTQDPVTHAFVAAANTFKIWRPRKIL